MNHQQPDRDHYPDPANNYWHHDPRPPEDDYRQPGVLAAIIAALGCIAVLFFIVWALIEWAT